MLGWRLRRSSTRGPGALIGQDSAIWGYGAVPASPTGDLRSAQAPQVPIASPGGTLSANHLCKGTRDSTPEQPHRRITICAHRVSLTSGCHYGWETSASTAGKIIYPDKCIDHSFFFQSDCFCCFYSFIYFWPCQEYSHGIQS